MTNTCRDFHPDGYTAIAMLAPVNFVDRAGVVVTDPARKRALWAAADLYPGGEFVNWTWRRMLEKSALCMKLGG